MTRKRKLEGQVVVITGASSGIGRAAALRYADEGARLVVAARSEKAVESCARECRARGADAIAVATDVTDEGAVLHLAEEARTHFGRIDVWVNNAGVIVFGRFEDIPMETFRKVMETNVIGYVHGARAALGVFREQGNGLLINVGSVTSEVPQPYASAYVMSKQAIRALGQCLRQELLLEEQENIHVCTVMPATIDTPLFQHAANYTGQAIKAIPPVYPPVDVAAMLVRLSLVPKAEVHVGHVGRLMNMEMRLAPRYTEHMMAKTVTSGLLDRHQAQEPKDGNLFEAGGDDAVTGGWMKVTKTTRRMAAAAVSAAVLLAAGTAFAIARSRNGAADGGT